MTEDQKREAREAALRRQWANRKGFKHSAQYVASRTVNETDESADYSAGCARFTKAVTLSRTVRGCTLIVRPDASSRDKRKAFKHWCRENGVTLVPVEAAAQPNTVCAGDTVRAETLVTAFQAFGSAEALFAMTLHKYVRHEKGEAPRWTFATKFRGTYGQTELARKPVAKIPYKPQGAYEAGSGIEYRELMAERADETVRLIASTDDCDGAWVLTLVASPEATDSVQPVWEAAYRHAELYYGSDTRDSDGDPVPYTHPDLSELIDLM